MSVSFAFSLYLAGKLNTLIFCYIIKKIEFILGAKSQISFSLISNKFEFSRQKS